MISESSFSAADHCSVREDERKGLKALFERVFFDVPYAADALEALRRTDFRGGEPTGADDAAGAPAAEKSFETPRTILLYRGESGIGKTRIFRQFRGHAEERRIPVYEIHCYDVEGIPFKPFLRVIREILRDFEFGDVLREKYRPGLEALLPEIFTRNGDTRSAVATPGWEVGQRWEEDRLRIFDGITQLLFEITALRPVVILVHDLNWGDQATVELLRYIGRNIAQRNARFEGWKQSDAPALVETAVDPGEDWGEDPEELDDAPEARERFYPGQTGVERGAASDLEDRLVRLMILANYQGDPAADNYLERALRSLGEEPFAYHGEIRRMSPDETRAFVTLALAEAGLQADAGAVDRIHATAEGFPCYIEELLRLAAPTVRDRTTLTPADIERAIPIEEDGGDVPDRGAGEASAAEDGSESATDSGEESADDGPGVSSKEADGDDNEAGDADSGEETAPSPQAISIRHGILRRRLEATDDDELAVLRVLAYARKPLTSKQLARILDASTAEVQSTLQRLDEKCLTERVAQLFPRAEEHDGYFFRIRDYADVVARTITDADERVALHQRIGEEVLEQIGSGRDEKNFEVFYHLRQGTEPRTSVDYGWRAATRFARSFSIEKAVHLLDELLGVLDGEEDLETRVRVLERKAVYQMALKQFDSALESLERLLEEGGSTLDDARKAEIYLHEGEVHRLAGDTNRALKALNRSFKLIKEINSPLGVEWHLANAVVRLDRGDVKRAINVCLKGVKIVQKHLLGSSEEDSDAAAPGSGEVPLVLRSRLYQLLAQAFKQRGDYVHAVENFRRALDGFESAGDEAATARVLDDLGTVYLAQGTYFRAARYFYRALEIKRRTQDIAGLCVSYDQLGMVYLRTGDELKTIAHLTHSIRLKGRIGDLLGLNPTLGVMGELHARLGRYMTALSFFDRAIHNSEVVKDTRGLVDAFIRKGWLFYEIGDRKQVDGLTRQTAILASEFKLKFQEATSARLRGRHEALRRNWEESDAEYKKSLEIYSKLGNRRQEAKVLLDQATSRYDRESYDDALKLASKALVLAEELQAVDLQARSHVIKGNIFRFLKGGSREKAREHLDRAYELCKSLNDVHPLFETYYSLAKLYHYDRDFTEAGNFYGKAEAIIRRVADGLPDDLAGRYLEDPRRKVFLDDANRFRREVQGRPTTADERERAEVEERTGDLTGYRALNAAVLRVNAAQNAVDFPNLVLQEAIDLGRAARGFLLRVRSRRYALAAQYGFGETPEEHPDYPSAQSIAEEAIRKGKSFVITGSDNREKEERFFKSRGLYQRSLLVVPVRARERIYGALYLDRPINMGSFSRPEEQIIEMLTEHIGTSLDNRRLVDLAMREPLTGLYTTSYLLERLREAYRLNNLHGRPFFLIGYYLPTLEASMNDEARLLGERLAAEISEELPDSAIASWGSPILTVLATETTLPNADNLAQRLEGRLISLVNGRVAYQIVGPEARIPNSVSLYYELRRRLLPEESDQQTLMEIRQLLSREITLKDAKLILEKHIIENTLRKTGGNITHAAKELGIHRPQLSSLLKKHDLKRELFERAADFESKDRRENGGRRNGH